MEEQHIKYLMWSSEVSPSQLIFTEMATHLAEGEKSLVVFFQHCMV